MDQSAILSTRFLRTNEQPVERVAITATADAQHHAIVDITGAADAPGIRQLIFQKLSISPPEYGSLAIFRTELGEAALGDPVSDDQLLKYCELWGDKRGTLMFLVQRVSGGKQGQWIQPMPGPQGGESPEPLTRREQHIGRPQSCASPIQQFPDSSVSRRPGSTTRPTSVPTEESRINHPVSHQQPPLGSKPIRSTRPSYPCSPTTQSSGRPIHFVDSTITIPQLLSSPQTLPDDYLCLHSRTIKDKAGSHPPSTVNPRIRPSASRVSIPTKATNGGASPDALLSLGTESRPKAQRTMGRMLVKNDDLGAVDPVRPMSSRSSPANLVGDRLWNTAARESDRFCPFIPFTLPPELHSDSVASGLDHPHSDALYTKDHSHPAQRSSSDSSCMAPGDERIVRNTGNSSRKPAGIAVARSSGTHDRSSSRTVPMDVPIDGARATTPNSSTLSHQSPLHRAAAPRHTSAPHLSPFPTHRTSTQGRPERFSPAGLRADIAPPWETHDVSSLAAVKRNPLQSTQQRAQIGLSGSPAMLKQDETKTRHREDAQTVDDRSGRVDTRNTGFSLMNNTTTTFELSRTTNSTRPQVSTRGPSLRVDIPAVASPWSSSSTQTLRTPFSGNSSTTVIGTARPSAGIVCGWDRDHSAAPKAEDSCLKPLSPSETIIVDMITSEAAPKSHQPAHRNGYPPLPYRASLLASNMTLGPEETENNLETVLISLRDLDILLHRLTPLPRGGYSDVRRATLDANSPSPRSVAVRELRPMGVRRDRERLVSKLASELRVWAGVKHPNILPIVGFHLSDDFTVANLISLCDAQENVWTYVKRQKPSPTERLNLAIGATQGLSHLHGLTPPICHGDLKAANILVSADRRAMLCDFGLAQMLGDAASDAGTSTGLQASTRYLSPEVMMRDNFHRTLKSDIWALGCVLVEMVYDLKPYADITADVRVVLAVAQGKMPAALDKLAISDEMRALVLACWELEEEKRPDSAACLKSLHSIHAAASDSHGDISPLTLD